MTKATSLHFLRRTAALFTPGGLGSNGTHFTELRALAAFKKPLFLQSRLAPAAQVSSKVSAHGWGVSRTNAELGRSLALPFVSFPFVSLILVSFVDQSTIPSRLAFGQEQPKVAIKAKQEEPKGLTKYLGRRVAPPMGYMHMNWLSRPERIQEENPQEMLDQLNLKDGMVVCDLGSGDGYHTLQIAPRVGPSGKVVAVDIQPQMLQELSRKLAEKKLENVETVLGELWDPKLPEKSVDLVLLVDVYHEFSHPVHMLAALRKALKPNGLIALVEFRAEDPTVLIRAEHKMTKAQILKEYSANGYKVAKEYDRLPWQHLMFMQCDDSWTEKK